MVDVREVESYQKAGLPYRLTGHDMALAIFQQEIEGGEEEGATVNSIYRIKQNSKEGSKDYIFYYRVRKGIKWNKDPIWSPEETIGRYNEVIPERVFDQVTKKPVTKGVSGVKEKYYTTFSREEVDKIVDGSLETNKHTINFYVMDNSGATFSVPYDEFVGVNDIDIALHRCRNGLVGKEPIPVSEPNKDQTQVSESLEAIKTEEQPAVQRRLRAKKRLVDNQ